MGRRLRPHLAHSTWSTTDSQYRIRLPLLLLLLGGFVLLTNSMDVRPAAAQSINQCAPPSVSLRVSPPAPVAGQAVTFSFAAVAAPPLVAGGGCANPPLPFMLINFGDGRAPLPLNGPSGTISHVYSVPGSYAVLVTANSGGRIGQARAIVTVAPGAQQAAVTLRATPLTVRAGDLVDFLGQVVAADPNAVTTSATIYFGDGQAVTPQTTGAGFLAQHAYSSVGTYAATLSVENSSGQIAQASVTITVVPRTLAWP